MHVHRQGVPLDDVPSAQLLCRQGTLAKVSFVFFVCGSWECLGRVMVRIGLADQNEWPGSPRNLAFSSGLGAIFFLTKSAPALLVTEN